MGAVNAVALNVTATELAAARWQRCIQPFPFFTRRVSHRYSRPEKHKIPATAATDSWKLAEAAVKGFAVSKHRAAKASAVGGSYSRRTSPAISAKVSITADRVTDGVNPATAENKNNTGMPITAEITRWRKVSA